MYQRSGIPRSRISTIKSSIPIKNRSLNTYGPTDERKKNDNKISQYALLTSSSLKEQKQLYDDFASVKKDYESEIETISMENQNIKDIFLNFSVKWIQEMENQINATNSALSQKVEGLNSQILQYEFKFNQLFNAYIILKREDENLKNQIASEKNKFQIKSQEFNQLKNEFDLFRSQSLNNNQEIFSLQSNNQQFEREIRNLQDKITNMNFDYENIQDQYNKLNDLYDVLQNESKNKDDLITDLKSQIDSDKHLSSVLEMNQKNLLSENKVLKEKLEMSNQMLERLDNKAIDHSELQRKTEEIEKLRESINTKDLEIEQLRYHNSELANKNDNNQLEFIKEQITLKDQEIESLNKKIIELTNQLNQGDSLQNFVDSLSKIADENEQSKALKEEIDQKDKIIQTMSNQIKLKDNELISLRETCEEINQKNNLITKKDNLINDLKQTIETMKNDIMSKINSIDELQSNLKKQEQTISSLYSKLDEKDQMIDNLESQASNINHEKESNEKENNEMKTTIDSMTTMIQSMKTKYNNLESTSSNEIAQLKEKAQLLELQNEESQSLIKDQTEQIKELTSRQAFYIQKMKEGDQLAIENDSLKTDFSEQNKKLEETQVAKENLEKNLKQVEEEKNKISLEYSQIEYDRNKLLEKVQEFEMKFDKNLEEEKDQLSQYVKELEEQILDLNTKNQKVTLLENQIKNYDEEMNSLKMMLDTYKKINEVLQDKLNQSNKQNNELIAKVSNESTSQFNQMSTSPASKCTIACSPFKFDNRDFGNESLNLNPQEILNENENLKKEIEKWKKAANKLQNKVQSAELDRNFYQSECGRLNSTLATNEYDQETSIKTIEEKDNEISKLKTNCEKLRNELSQLIAEKKELNETFNSTSLKLNSTQRSFDELRSQYKKFTTQLSNILHKDTETEIILQVIHIINSTRDLQVKDTNQIASKMHYFSVNHISKIDSFSKEINLKLDTTLSSFTRIDRKIKLTSRKFSLNNSQSKIVNRLPPGRPIPATERKKPLKPLINVNLNSDSMEQKSTSNRYGNRFAQRSDPSNFGDITSAVKDLIFS